MDKEITIELIRVTPTAIWILILCFLLFRYRRQIEGLMSRVARINVFGVQAEFAQAREQLINAAQSYGLSPNDKEVKTIIERADRIRDLLHGSRILWTDDQYLGNANIFRFLNAYGVVIDEASTTEEALTALKWASEAYEAVVTDMVRGDDQSAGIRLINGMRNLHIPNPVIVFVAKVDPTRGTPLGAVAITDNPIQLIHHFMNVLESSSKGD